MNQLTSARTLREIADLIAGSVGARATAPCRSAAPPPPAAADRRPQAAITLPSCVKIASERTGYEPDMLDLDAGIESDLGIDSIKRVEILTAFQQRSTRCRADPNPGRHGEADQRPHAARNRRSHRRGALGQPAPPTSAAPGRPAPAGSPFHPDRHRQAAQPVQAAILSGARLPDHGRRNRHRLRRSPMS